MEGMKRFITRERGLELRNNIRKANEALADPTITTERAQWWASLADYAERSLDLGYEMI